MSTDRVTRVTPFAVAYPEPNDAMSIRHLTFARVETADGTVGWGEAIAQFPEAARATAQLIEAMAQHVVGRDPIENVDIWRRIKAGSWWYAHHGGVAALALSAIDVALWDLKGKLLGRPLIDLLGGAHHERLPAIASTHAYHADLDVEVERHGRYVREEGYRGVKIGFGKRGEARLGYELERDVAFVGRLREAVGPDAWIMIDRAQHLPWDLEQAIRRTNAFEAHGLKWIEEPFEPHELASFRTLRRHARCLIGAGEREWDADGFRRLLDAGAIEVIGCDVGRAQGITGALRVIQLVEDAGAWFNSHAWSSAVNTAASIALSASTPRCLVQELKPQESPMQHELVDEPIVQRDGWIEPLRTPGLGVEPKESVLRRYRIGGFS